MRQAREQRSVVVGQPAIEGSIAHPLDGVEQTYGDDFAGPQRSLTVVRYIPHLVVYFAEQHDDKILGGHAVLLSLE